MNRESKHYGQTSSDSSPDMKVSGSHSKHWLYRPENRRTLWIILAVLLVLSIIPEFFVHHYAHFEQQAIHLDASFGFYAWYGFLACAVMVFVAKLLGFILQRKDTYYDE